MENNQNTYHINPAITVAVILQLVFIVFAGITIYNILNHNVGTPKIKISNYSVIPGGKVISENNTKLDIKDLNFTLDDTAKKTIESTIYNIASINNEGGISNHGAKIREGSTYYVYVESLNGYFLNFIVDIEDLEQSYRFVWLFNNDSSSQEDPKIELLRAFCPKEDEMIYSDFNCKDDYGGRGADIVAYSLIQNHLFDNLTTKMSNVYNGDPLKIEIQLPPGEEPAESAAVQELSEYLLNFGFNLDDFEYETIRLEPFIIRR